MINSELFLADNIMNFRNLNLRELTTNLSKILKGYISLWLNGNETCVLGRLSIIRRRIH